MLRCWALPFPVDSKQTMIVEALPDHRLEYLDYQGPVSKNRGNVFRWDHGWYTSESQTKSKLIVRLSGEKILGYVTLTRIADKSQRWRFLFSTD